MCRVPNSATAVNLAEYCTCKRCMYHCRVSTHMIIIICICIQIWYRNGYVMQLHDWVDFFLSIMTIIIPYRVYAVTVDENWLVNVGRKCTLWPASFLAFWSTKLWINSTPNTLDHVEYCAYQKSLLLPFLIHWLWKNAPFCPTPMLLHWDINLATCI